MRKRSVSGIVGVIALLVIASSAVFGALTPRDQETIADDESGSGIGIRGAWEITVADRNGQIVSQTSFHNTLPQTGRFLLARILGVEEVIGYWGLAVGGSGDAICVGGTGNPADCFLFAPGYPIGAPGPNHTLDTVSFEADLESVTITGSVTAARDGQITNVQTRPTLCALGSTPGSCVITTGGSSLTIKTLDAPIVVAEGQQVNVSVTLTFGGLP